MWWLAVAGAAEPCLEARFLRVDGLLLAIQVPVQLDVATTDEVLWAQLDTGVGPALRLQEKALAGRISPLRGLKRSGNKVSPTLGGAIGGHRFPPQPVEIVLEEGTAGGRIGSVGARAFAGRVLVLDLKDDKVCVVDEVPPAPACVAPLSLDALGRPLVEVDGLGTFLLDTGSAPQGLWVDAKRFEQLTGKAHTDPTVLVYPGKAFGKPLNAHRHAALEGVRLGAIALEKPSVTHVPGRPVETADRVGVLGLQPFDGSVVWIDLREGRLGRVGSGCWERPESP